MNLDNIILNIFKGLINNPEYLKEVNPCCGELIFDVNGTKIDVLRIDRSQSSNNKLSTFEDFGSNQFEIYFTCDRKIEEVCFMLVINKKRYFVPEMSRVETAVALDKLDKMIAAKEESMLTDIANSFNDAIIDDTDNF